jgi:hypothetical protein
MITDVFSAVRVDMLHNGDKLIDSRQLLCLRHGDSSGMQNNGNVNRWKPLPEHW